MDAESTRYGGVDLLGVVNRETVGKAIGEVSDMETTMAGIAYDQLLLLFDCS